MTVGPADLSENLLYYGDNLKVLNLHVRDESIDLVYLDPPFKSNRDYNVIFEEQDGTKAKAQIKVFEDTWTWDEEAAAMFAAVCDVDGTIADTMLGLKRIVGTSDMLAYLSMMAPRLIELRRVLKETGSIYLHCDPTASHYLKLLMDAIFGPEHFQNEIVWAYRGGGVSKRRFGRKHDIIFFYSKASDHYFRPQYMPYSDSTVAVTSRTGRRVNKTSIDLERGGHMTDWWADINSLQTWSPERLGYETQKPVALLRRIIDASCPEDGVVLDPFCGCGTAIVAAQQAGRQWTGIDVTQAAMIVIKKRLKDLFGSSAKYRVIGEPATVADAETLAGQDPYQFQWWALGLVGARRADERRGADRGIDGQLLFHDEKDQSKAKTVVFSVKSGGISPMQVRDLRGVVERDEAAIGVLITMHEPTAAMRSEAASAGFYVSPWGRHARIQILTIDELLRGKQVDYPHPQQANVTFRRARHVPPKPEKPLALGLELHDE